MHAQLNRPLRFSEFLIMVRGVQYHQTAVVPRESILKTEAEWLNSIKADLVVSDVVPAVFRAATDAGIRSVCVTNFSWDFTYAEYVVAAGHHHRSIVWQSSPPMDLEKSVPRVDLFGGVDVTLREGKLELGLP